MFNRLKHTLITFLQLILVIAFIFFEEIIWEGIAKPIYSYVHELKVLQKMELWLQGVNATVILVIFVLMLASVEMLGIYAGLMFVSGHVLLGLSIYLTKIPIAAFTFWMFRVTKEKLMGFGWFAWLYGRIMAFIDWLKSLSVYRETIAKLKQVKSKLKVWGRAFKVKYLSKESPFVTRLKQRYRILKRPFKRN